MRLLAMTTAAALALALSTPALAASNCTNTGEFGPWLESFKKEAIAEGIPAKIVADASPYLKFEQRIINRDRGQSVFQQSFLTFSDRVAGKARLDNGLAQLARNKPLFDKVEKEFGVSRYVLASFWGLESDFGAITGKSHILSSIATLAYDCRRSDYFRKQLKDALRIIQRGDITLAEMIGGDWAGELGAMQFTATDYYEAAVDYDGDGRRDLIKSVPDTIASGGNFLKLHGWKRGEPWLHEVIVPAQMDWKEADLTIKHPRSQWVKWGVKGAHGTMLPADNMQASLLLPMGRLGPAFLAYENFTAMQGWNDSMVYVTTVAYFATRLAGAPPVNRGQPGLEVMTSAQAKELQALLEKEGHDVGEIDGKIGAKTRAAVKKAQLKYKLPADSFATIELLAKLGGKNLDRPPPISQQR